MAVYAKFYPLELILRLLIGAAAFVVIGSILAITINPIEFVRFNRDRQRISSLKNLTDLIRRVEAKSSQEIKSEKNVVYISLPDNDSKCSGWQSKGLPPLAEGFSYRCSPSENYRNIDGTGWIPVNLALLGVEGIEKLPIDPRNGKTGFNQEKGKETLFFYQYVSGSVFLQAVGGLESEAGQRQLSEVELDKELLATTERFASGLPANVVSGSLANNFIVAAGDDIRQTFAVIKNAVEATEPALRNLGISPRRLENIKSAADLLPQKFVPETPAADVKPIPKQTLSQPAIIIKKPLPKPEPELELKPVLPLEEPAPLSTKTKFSQIAYRWFENDNSLSAGNSLTLVQNVSATAPLPPFRLRLILAALEDYSGSNNFKLQLARSTDGVCNDGFAGENYQEISSSAGDIRFYDTPIKDGVIVEVNPDDPEVGPIYRTYQESNPFTELNNIPKNDYALWDFSLVNYSAPKNSTYCFRTVFDDSRLLHSYLIIPELHIGF